MIRILLLLLFPICSFGQSVLLTGYVKDGKTNLPIQNAKVKLYLGSTIGELNTVTKENGYYEFKAEGKPADRDYPFTIQMEGYQRLTGVVRLNFGNSPARTYSVYPSAEEDIVSENPIVPTTQETPSLIGAPVNNLIFLIDISGSMNDENRLENLKKSLNYLLSFYRPEDKISIITYATTPNLELNKGSVSEIEKISKIIQKLKAGGQSKGIDGLKMAYEFAMQNHKSGGNNKIILATDGYFGMDSYSQKIIEQLISKGNNQGVKLSIFSFGKKDEETKTRLEKWCKAGSGYYTNITSLELAKDQIIKEAKGN